MQNVEVSELHTLFLPCPQSALCPCREQESALAAGGCRETHSELSRVLDELDVAAADDSAVATARLVADVRE